MAEDRKITRRQGLDELACALMRGLVAGRPVPEVAHPDLEREERRGMPEVVLAEGKRPEHVIEIAAAFLAARGRAIISRASPPLARRLKARFADCAVESHALARLVVVRRPDFRATPTGGIVGLITAGTADLPVAEEARAIAQQMGCTVITAYDVGVAGLHRLLAPLHQMLEGGVDAIIVAAGMDGALPSVVAGLVDVPVIGLPTSVGYGAGGQGLAALLSMLQTCSPGLVVVNIDNGIGAGATAALIANRVARARAHAAPSAPEELTDNG